MEKDPLIEIIESGDWEEKYRCVKMAAKRMCRSFGLVKTHYILGRCNVDEIELKTILWEEDFIEAPAGVWRQNTLQLGF